MIIANTIDFKLLTEILSCVVRALESEINAIDSTTDTPKVVHYIPGWGKKSYLEAPTLQISESQRIANERNSRSKKILLINLKAIKGIYYLRSNTDDEFTLSSKDELENIAMVLEEYEYCKAQINLTGAQKIRLKALYDSALEYLE